jgi:hypothetical protein
VASVKSIDRLDYGIVDTRPEREFGADPALGWNGAFCACELRDLVMYNNVKSRENMFTTM